MVATDLAGMRVTVMGLGLHGGGAETARFLHRNGAQVTVTDLRSRDALQSALEGLSALPLRFVLGRHEENDFRNADIVVKNPAVPRTSPLLPLARRIETDISLFLRFSRNPLLAVTGSKGKSTTVSALHHAVAGAWPDSRLGGNITVSPLSFLEDLSPAAPVVLELSSFQLGDLGLVQDGIALLNPAVSCITNILRDHQNYYHSMERYVSDKRVIYRSQGPAESAVFSHDDEWDAAWGPRFADDCRASVFSVSRHPVPSLRRGAYARDGEAVFMLPDGETRIDLKGSVLPGVHQGVNLVTAGLMALLYGVPREIVASRLIDFPGIEHRLEPFAESNGVRYINDSAATIPEATLEAISSFHAPVVLIAGGTDKELSFEPFRSIGPRARRIYLLSGTGTERIMEILRGMGISFNGPFDSLDECVARVVADGEDGEVVLFSPGCTSFGMFLNEFDRGRRFKAAVRDAVGSRS